jgi:phage baseplate assembly protein W
MAGPYTTLETSVPDSLAPSLQPFPVAMTLFVPAAVVCPPLPPVIIPAVAQNPLVGVTSSTDFGQDFSFLNGLDPYFNLVSGIANLGQALAHRLETPRGSLFSDANYGTDIRDSVNDSVSPASLAEMAADAQAECSKDERVLSCTATAQFSEQTDTLSLTISVQTSSGPFLFVFTVSQVTVSLLSSVSTTGS